MKLHAWTSSNVTQNNNMNSFRFRAQPQCKYGNNYQTNYYVSKHLNKKYGIMYYELLMVNFR